MRDEWLDTLPGPGRTDPTWPPLLQGRLTRLLVDAELVGDAPARLHRALSYGSPAATKAAWVEGFFTDGAVLLVHDPALRGLLDGLGRAASAEAEFVDVLPLVRRTFGTFSPAQRRALASRLRPRRPRRAATTDVPRLSDLAGPALATVEADPAAGRRG